ncbi:MAG: cytochrome c3 family protein [Bryobacterales bacterium]|nr:cytochrome c3 family protein [Bryobacterales bacterium]
MRLLLILLLSFGIAPAQDGPFSHKKHAPLKLACTYCHTTAEKEDRAGFPALATCRTCHPAIADRKIPAQRVYRVKDFVVFRHAAHSAQAACATCHGEVYTLDTISRAVRPTTMIECVDCHKSKQASVQCNLCHELGQ